MSSDPLLKAAIAHWGPRFVANGVVLTDFEEITASLSSYDDWCRAWSARAAHHEELGRAALSEKHFLTAGECLQRAAVYYHFGSFLFAHDPAQMKAAHKKQIECRLLALPHLSPPGERVEIPYLGKTLGRHSSQTRRRRQTARGGDGGRPRLRPRKKPTPTRRRFSRAGWRRWYSRGRARARRNTTFRSAATTKCQSKPSSTMSRRRSDLDRKRIGMWGVSLGGYYAPRATAFEQAHQGLHRAGRAVRLRRGLRHDTGPDARDVPHSQPLQDRQRKRARTRRHYRSPASRRTSPVRSSS